MEEESNEEQEQRRGETRMESVRRLMCLQNDVLNKT